MLSKETIDLFIKHAKRKTWDEDEDDMSGGNYDDTYAAGQRDGVTYLARDILAELKISWE